MKIICIGRNYKKHAEELGNQVPTEPLIFIKPSTALLNNNKPFFIPEFIDNLHYEVEVVLKIKRHGKHIQPKFALDYVEAISLGIDFTARGVQQQLKEKGHPWEIAKGFDHSAPIGKFIPVSLIKDLEEIKFSLYKNDEQVQLGNTKNMIFSFTELIVHTSKYFTLNKGDLIFTGTPEGVGKVESHDILKAYLGNQLLLKTKVI